MLGKFVFRLLLIKAFLLHEAHSQCNGIKQKISPADKSQTSIKSPNFPKELGNTANCIWEFATSNGKEYMLVITVERLRLYYVVDDIKNCSENYVLKMNQDTVDCKKYVDAPHTDTFCKAYYSSSKCNTNRLQDCQTKERTSFPIRVTYKTDGKNLIKPSSRTSGFKMKYEYIKCENSGCSVDDEDCAVSGSGNDSKTSSGEGNTKPNTVTTTTKRPLAITKKESRLLSTPTDREPETTHQDLDNVSASYDYSPIIIIVMGGVIFILIVIISVLFFRRRSTSQPNEAPIAHFYENVDTPGVVPGAGAPCTEAASEEQKQAYYVNISETEENAVENPYEIPIQRPQNVIV